MCPSTWFLPSLIRLAWATAVYDWLRVTEDRVLTVLKRKDLEAIAGAKSCAAARSAFDFLIISYDLLKDGQDLLHELGFKVVVLDESHYIKSPKVRLQ
jgi:SNF2 family DNA or RNA helicase